MCNCSKSSGSHVGDVTSLQQLNLDDHVLIFIPEIKTRRKCAFGCKCFILVLDKLKKC